MVFFFGKSKPPTKTVEVEATAYCGCGRCCGWEHGIGLGPLPVYLPLAWRRRASGTQPVPLLPRMRKSEYGREDRRRGAAWGVYYGAALGACLWTAESLVGLPARGGLGVVKAVIRRCPKLSISQPATALGAAASAIGWAVQTPVTISAATFGALGYSVFPVSQYWAETHLAGRRYEGTTATNRIPKTPVPPLLSLDTLKEPWTIPHRLLLFRWGGVDGSIAADTTHFPFGTRMRVPGYGWGVVEDRGGAIKGPVRIDLFHRDHLSALRWGRQTVKVAVEQS